LSLVFLPLSANHPSFLNHSDQKAGISIQIRLKPLCANALRIDQQALITETKSEKAFAQ